MKPYDFIFKNLKSLSDQTQLLEACDWSEEKVNELFSHCIDIVNNLQEREASADVPIDVMIEDMIREDFTHQQKAAMKDIIRGLVESTLSDFQNEN